jgi:hypothetical protein
MFSTKFYETFPLERSHHNTHLSSVVFGKGEILSTNQKEKIVEEIVIHNVKTQTICEYLHLTPRTVQKMVQRKKEGKILFEKTGNPPRIDGCGIATGFLTIQNGKETHSPLDKPTTNVMIRDIARDKRRGLSGLNFKISHHTIKKHREEMNISFEQGQTTTNARERETLDIRNFVSQAALNEAFAKNLNPLMISNVDATSYGVSDNSIELLATVKEDGDKPLTQVGNEKFDIGIKWFAIMNANGNLGKNVFLVSDPSLEEGSFSCKNIKSLSHSLDLSSDGWLCFSRTRNGNKDFFKWMFKEVIIPFVKECRQSLPSNNNEHFFLSFDGEDVQLSPFDDEEMIDLLDEDNTYLVKGPASCTHTIGNACDRSNLFKASKHNLKHLKDYEDLNLLQKIKYYLDSEKQYQARNEQESLTGWCE